MNQAEPINLLEQATISHVSNDHYGHPKDAVLGNRLEHHMKGWGSARSGFGEQAVFSFDQPISLNAFVVDTYLHRLNAPLSCHLFGLAPEHDLLDSMRSIPRWSIQFENGNQVVPDDFQAYMQDRRYATAGEDWPDEFIIHLDHSRGDHWQPLLPFQALKPDTYHRFETFETTGWFQHLLFLHYPNGGIHGLKAFGDYQS
jgi:allantoicase